MLHFQFKKYKLSLDPKVLFFTRIYSLKTLKSTHKNT